MICILNKAPLLYRAAFCKNITLGRMTKLILARNCKHQTNKTPVRMQERFRLKDNVSYDYKLIYRDEKKVLTIIFSTYHFGWIGLFATLSCMVYVLYDVFVLQTPEDHRPDSLLGVEMSPLSHLHRFDLLCIATLMASMLIIYSRAIPIRIYHNPKEKLYKVVLINNIFRKGKVVTFAEGSAVPVFKRGSFIKDSLFYVNNNRMILLDEDSFPVPAEREKMLCKTT
ncbi:hypothetical protein DMN91_012370 [Ooceraea biroi]|uniref:Uncharacterized protein n=1 Tax=Ooceraea biroi TaxID=2015173 RepID=A0A3L8D568_OOCBI|nr:uncharacterized protein LOC105286261 [Ooceraea biroi]RLU15376.1 hypothetical protein DMN91_012370 [Ooceraea biroi]